MNEEIYRQVNDNMYLRRNDADQRKEEGGKEARKKGAREWNEIVGDLFLLSRNGEIKSGLESSCFVSFD